MNSSIVVNILHQLYDPRVTPSKISQLHSELRSYEKKDECGIACLQILQETHVDYVYVAAISVLEDHIKRRCLLSPNPVLINEINVHLWPIVVSSSNSVVGGKLAHLIVFMAKYDLSSSPVHVINKILEMLSSFKTVLVGSQMLLSVSELFLQPKGVLTKRSLQLEEGLRSQIPHMFLTAFNVLDVLFCLNTDEKIANGGVFFSNFFGDGKNVTENTFCHSVACNLLKILGNLMPLSKTEALDVHFLTILFRFAGLEDNLAFKFGFSSGNELSGSSLRIVHSIIQDKLIYVRHDAIILEILQHSLWLVQKRLSKATNNYTQLFKTTDPHEMIIFDKSVEFFKIIVDKFVARFDQFMQKRWSQIFYYLTFSRDDWDHLLECLQVWEKYLDLLNIVKSQNHPELIDVICKLVVQLVDRLCSYKPTGEFVYEDCIEENDLIHSALSVINNAVLLYPRDVLNQLNDFSQRVYTAFYGYSQNTIPSSVLDQITVSVKITGSLVPLFDSSFEGYFLAANNYLSCILKLAADLQSLAQDTLLVNTYECCRMFSMWVKQYLVRHGWDKSKDVIGAIITLALRAFTETYTHRNNHVVHSAAVMLRTFLQTVRPPILHSSLMLTYSQLVNSMMGSASFADSTRVELFASYSNFLILPWNAPGGGDQQWESRRAEHANFVQKLYSTQNNLMFLQCSTKFISLLQCEGSAVSRDICMTSFRDIIARSVSCLNSTSLLSGALYPSYFEFITAVMYSFRAGISVEIIKSIFKVFCDLFSSFRDVGNSHFSLYFKNNPNVFDSLLTAISVAFKHTNTSLHHLVTDVLNILLTDQFFAFSREVSAMNGLRAIFDIVEAILTFQWHFFASKSVPGVFASESAQNIFLLIVKAYETSFFETDLELCQKNLKFLKNFTSKTKIFQFNGFKEHVFPSVIESCLSLVRSAEYALIWEDVLSLLFEVADSDWSLYNQRIMPLYVSSIQSRMSSLNCPPLDISWTYSGNEYSKFVDDITALMSDARLCDEFIRC